MHISLNKTKLKKYTPAIVMTAFFLSGATSLIYEILWMKQLTLVFGASIFAISSTIAIFFSGLALGSFLFGRLSDNFSKPLLIYALIEIGIGSYALLTPFVFNFVEYLQIFFVHSFSVSLITESFLNLTLSFIALIIPATLIGGTLPVIIKYFSKEIKQIGLITAKLYSINTFGGVLGVILAGFVLISWLGIWKTNITAALINIAIGLLVLSIYRTSISFELLRKLTFFKSTKKVPPSSKFKFISTAFFLSGFAAIALEVLWTRALILTIGISTYAFSIILVTFLFGIGIGSILATRFVNKFDEWNAFGYLEIIRGILAILIIPLFSFLPIMYLSLVDKLGWTFGMSVTTSLILTMTILLLPTLFMGATFPVVAKIVSKNLKNVGSSVGRIYFFNTIGGVLGALVAGFIMVPVFGVQTSMVVVASIYLLTGAALLYTSKSLKQTHKNVFIFITLIFILGGILLPDWNIKLLQSEVYSKTPKYLESDASRFTKDIESSKILFYEEGLLSLVSVEDDGNQLLLKINGKVQSGSEGDKEAQLLLGHLPLLFHVDAKSALVVGLGSGMTLGAVEQHKELEKIFVVELEPEVFEAAKYFNEFNNEALGDSRLESIVGDGRNFLLTTNKKFDVITSEPSNPWIKGMASLYTKEYFELANERLNDGGIMAVWMQLNSIDSNDLKSFLNTFRSTFREVLVFEVEDSVVLLGSQNFDNQPFDLFKERVSEGLVISNLGKIDVYSAHGLMRYFAFNTDILVAIIGDNKELHTDDNPFLEYSSPKSFYRGVETKRKNQEELLTSRKKSDKLFSETRSEDSAVLGSEFNARSFYLGGLFAFEDFNLTEAAKLLENGFALNSRYTPLNNLLKLTYGILGSENQSQGLFDVSEGYFKRLTTNFPNESLGWSDLGFLYANQGRYDEALVAFNTSLDLNPNDVEVYVYKGSALREMKRFDDAIVALKKALSLNPSSTTALNNLGLTYQRSQNKELAIDALHQSLEINPDQREIRALLSKIENE